MTTFASIRHQARRDRRAAKQAREELSKALLNLPAPQFEVELAVPKTADGDDDDMAVDTVLEADQAELDTRERREEQQRAQEEYERRSTVLRRPDLPRPSVVDTLVDPGLAPEIAQELELLLKHDAHKFPPKKRRKITSTAAPIELEELANLPVAKLLIETERDSIIQAKVDQAIAGGKASDREEALLLLTQCNVEACRADIVYVPDAGWIETPSDEDRKKAIRYEIEVLESATDALRKKNDKTAKKLDIKSGGYRQRASKLHEESLQAYSTWMDSVVEQRVYERLKGQEEAGGASRLQNLRTHIAALRQTEKLLQNEYGALLVQKKRRLQADQKKVGASS
jgi:pre-mRNA splicing factor component